MWRRRQTGAWWGGLGLFLLLLLARAAVATPPSHPTGLTVNTISCGPTPVVQLHWNTSVPGSSGLKYYIVYKWAGADGNFKSDPCGGCKQYLPSSCTFANAHSCNSGCCNPQQPIVVPSASCTTSGCTWNETVSYPSFWYYAVEASNSTFTEVSQSTAPCDSGGIAGGGACDLSDCQPYPCYQCTYNGTDPCPIGAYCGTFGACLDKTPCVIGTTTTTTSTSTTSTTTTLVSACASPTVVPAGGGTFPATMSGASTLQGSCGSSGTSPEKVYQWTPNISGQATIQTCGGSTNFDTVLYMRANSCSSGTEIACNDDGPCACGSTCGGTWASKITPTVTSGQTYYIVVDGRNGVSGNFTLTVTPPGAFKAGIVTDPAIVETEPNIPRPAYLTAITPAPFAVPVKRIANDTGTSTSPASGTWGMMAYHTYSKQQPWNADESLITIENNSSPSHLLLNGSTYAPIGTFCGNYSYYDFRWHPTMAHKNEQINVTSGGTELMWFDVVACTKTRTWSLPITSSYGIGSGEGNPSNDGRYVAIASATQVLVVDMDPQAPLQTYAQGNRRIGPARDVSSCGLADCTIDWVSMSSSGKYVVVHYQGDNNQVFDVDVNTLALSPHAVSSSACRCLSTNSSCTAGSASAGFVYAQGHADMASNPFDINSGTGLPEDVLIGQSQCGITGNTITGVLREDTNSTGSVLIGHVMQVRLRDGAILPLTDPTHPVDEAFAHHVSTRNVNRPGWAYVSYDTGNGKRFADEIIAVKMDGSYAVQRFAHSHSAWGSDQGVSVECYHCEVHVVPSPDGRRMLFASDWAQHCGSGCTDQLCTASGCGSCCSSGTGDVKTYVIDARGP